MFKSEAMGVVAQKKNRSDVEKFELTNLSRCIDLQRNPKTLVDRIANAKVFMSKQNNRLLIEILEGDTIHSIYFVNEHNNYSFKDFRGVMLYLDKKYK